MNISDNAASGVARSTAPQDPDTGSESPTTGTEDLGRPADAGDPSQFVDADVSEEVERVSELSAHPPTEHTSHVGFRWSADPTHEEWATVELNRFQLVAPQPRPGMVQRWVRLHSLNGSDAVNAQQRFREGWRPRVLDDLAPEYLVTLPISRHARLGQIIQVEEMILCERPEGLHKRQLEMEAEKTRDQALGVSANLEKQNAEFARAGFSQIQHQENVTVVGQRRPFERPADD